jgi:SpoVK/Ycf46/Vps4 family AAA+-type ATPase
MSGESEERIREVFNAAFMASPSILFIDSLDIVASKREVHIFIYIVIVIA